MTGRTPRRRGSGPVRLGTREAVSHVLRKHHLAPGSQGTNVSRVARDLVGLHATDPLSPYLSVLARMPNFESRMLDQELHEKRALARIPAMRNTLFMVPKALVGTLALGAKYGIESDQEVTTRVAAEHGLIERPA